MNFIVGYIYPNNMKILSDKPKRKIYYNPKPNKKHIIYDKYSK